MAYTVKADRGRIGVMQLSSLELVNALQDLHQLLSNYVQAYFNNHNYQISNDKLATCYIDLPQTLGLLIKPNQPTNLEDKSLPNDKAIPEEAGAALILG